MKALILLLTVVSGSIRVSLSDGGDTNLCSEQEGLFPKQGDCSSFIKCTNGNLKEISCPEDLLFNPFKRTCDYSLTGLCSTEGDFDESKATQTSEITCPAECSCVFPSNVSCSEYYRCEDGIAFKEKCSDGLLMNADILTCDYEAEVTCTTDENTDAITSITAIYVSDSDADENDFQVISSTEGATYRNTYESTPLVAKTSSFNNDAEVSSQASVATDISQSEGNIITTHTSMNTNAETRGFTESTSNASPDITNFPVDYSKATPTTSSTQSSITIYTRNKEPTVVTTHTAITKETVNFSVTEVDSESQKTEDSSDLPVYTDTINQKVTTVVPEKSSTELFVDDTEPTEATTVSEKISTKSTDSSDSYSKFTTHTPDAFEFTSHSSTNKIFTEANFTNEDFVTESKVSTPEDISQTTESEPTEVNTFQDVSTRKQESTSSNPKGEMLSTNAPSPTRAKTSDPFTSEDTSSDGGFFTSTTTKKSTENFSTFAPSKLEIFTDENTDVASREITLGTSMPSSTSETPETFAPSQSQTYLDIDIIVSNGTSVSSIKTSQFTDMQGSTEISTFETSDTSENNFSISTKRTIDDSKLVSRHSFEPLVSASLKPVTYPGEDETSSDVKGGATTENFKLITDKTSTEASTLLPLELNTDDAEITSKIPRTTGSESQSSTWMSTNVTNATESPTTVLLTESNTFSSNIATVTDVSNQPTEENSIATSTEPSHSTTISTLEQELNSDEITDQSTPFNEKRYNSTSSVSDPITFTTPTTIIPSEATFSDENTVVPNSVSSQSTENGIFTKLASSSMSPTFEVTDLNKDLEIDTSTVPDEISADSSASNIESTDETFTSSSTLSASTVSISKPITTTLKTTPDSTQYSISESTRLSTFTSNKNTAESLPVTNFVSTFQSTDYETDFTKTTVENISETISSDIATSSPTYTKSVTSTTFVPTKSEIPESEKTAVSDSSEAITLGSTLSSVYTTDVDTSTFSDKDISGISSTGSEQTRSLPVLGISTQSDSLMTTEFPGSVSSDSKTHAELKDTTLSASSEAFTNSTKPEFTEGTDTTYSTIFDINVSNLSTTNAISESTLNISTKSSGTGTPTISEFETDSSVRPSLSVTSELPSETSTEPGAFKTTQSQVSVTFTKADSDETTSELVFSKEGTHDESSIHINTFTTDFTTTTFSNTERSSKAFTSTKSDVTTTISHNVTQSTAETSMHSDETTSAAIASTEGISPENLIDTSSSATDSTTTVNPDTISDETTTLSASTNAKEISFSTSVSSAFEPTTTFSPSDSDTFSDVRTGTSKDISISEIYTSTVNPTFESSVSDTNTKSSTEATDDSTPSVDVETTFSSTAAASSESATYPTSSNSSTTLESESIFTFSTSEPVESSDVTSEFVPSESKTFKDDHTKISDITASELFISNSVDTGVPGTDKFLFTSSSTESDARDASFASQVTESTDDGSTFLELSTTPSSEYPGKLDSTATTSTKLNYESSTRSEIKSTADKLKFSNSELTSDYSTVLSTQNVTDSSFFTTAPSTSQSSDFEPSESNTDVNDHSREYSADVSTPTTMGVSLTSSSHTESETPISTTFKPPESKTSETERPETTHFSSESTFSDLMTSNISTPFEVATFSSPSTRSSSEVNHTFSKETTSIPTVTDPASTNDPTTSQFPTSNSQTYPDTSTITASEIPETTISSMPSELTFETTSVSAHSELLSTTAMVNGSSTEISIATRGHSSAISTTTSAIEITTDITVTNSISADDASSSLQPNITETPISEVNVTFTEDILHSKGIDTTTNNLTENTEHESSSISSDITVSSTTVTPEAQSISEESTQISTDATEMSVGTSTSTSTTITFESSTLTTFNPSEVDTFADFTSVIIKDTTNQSTAMIFTDVESSTAAATLTSGSKAISDMNATLSTSSRSSASSSPFDSTTGSKVQFSTFPFSEFDTNPSVSKSSVTPLGQSTASISSPAESSSSDVITAASSSESEINLNTTSSPRVTNSESLISNSEDIDIQTTKELISIFTPSETEIYSDEGSTKKAEDSTTKLSTISDLLITESSTVPESTTDSGKLHISTVPTGIDELTEGSSTFSDFFSTTETSKISSYSESGTFSDFSTVVSTEKTGKSSDDDLTTADILITESSTSGTSESSELSTTSEADATTPTSKDSVSDKFTEISKSTLPSFSTLKDLSNSSPSDTFDEESSTFSETSRNEFSTFSIQTEENHQTDAYSTTTSKSSKIPTTYDYVSKASTEETKTSEVEIPSLSYTTFTEYITSEVSVLTKKFTPEFSSSTAETSEIPSDQPKTEYTPTTVSVSEKTEVPTFSSTEDVTISSAPPAYSCDCENCTSSYADDCTKYYLCTNRKWVLSECSLGSLFNSDTGQCDEPKNVQCKVNYTKCSSPDGFYANINDCGTYFHCYRGLRYTKFCPVGLGYNPSKRTCEEDSDCGAEPINPTARNLEVSCDCESCIMPDSEDCSIYYLCLNGTAYDEQCGQGLLFNPLISSCDFAERVTCTKPSDLCERPNGYFKDISGNCSRYTHCVGGVSYQKECSTGKHFSEVTNQCEDACAAKCDLSLECPNTTSSSTVFSTETFSTSLSPSGDETQSTDIGTLFSDITTVTENNKLSTKSVTESTDSTDNKKFTESTQSHPPSAPSTTELSLTSDFSKFETDNDLISTSERTIFSTEDFTSPGFTSADSELPTTEVKTAGTSSTVQDIVSSTIDNLSTTASSDSTTLTPGTQENTSTQSTTSTGSSNQTLSDEVTTGVTDVKEFTSTVTSDNSSTNSDYDLRTTETVSSICDKGDGAYPKPGDCSAFYQCISGTWSEEQCPNDLHFSALTSICDTPCEAKCDMTVECPNATSSSTNYPTETTSPSQTSPFPSSDKTLTTDTEVKLFSESTTSSDTDEFSTKFVSGGESATSVDYKKFTESTPSYLSSESSITESSSTSEYSKSETDYDITSASEKHTTESFTTSEFISAKTELPTTEEKIPDTSSTMQDEVSTTTAKFETDYDLTSTSERHTTESFTTSEFISAKSEIPTTDVKIPDTSSTMQDEVSTTTAKFETDYDLTSTSERYTTENFTTSEFISTRTEIPTTEVKIPDTSSTTQDKVSTTTDDLSTTGTVSTTGNNTELTSRQGKSSVSSTTSEESSAQTSSDELTTGVTYLKEFSSTDFPTNTGYDLKTTETVSSICDRGDGAYPVAGDCNAFYRCESGVPSEEHCPKDLHFSASTSNCETPCEAKCDSSLECPITTTVASICVGPDGYYPDPENCQAFYECTDGNPILSFCVENEHFNPRTHICQDPCLALCDPNIECPNVTSPSTSLPTEAFSQSSTSPSSSSDETQPTDKGTTLFSESTTSTEKDEFTTKSVSDYESTSSSTDYTQFTESTSSYSSAEPSTTEPSSTSESSKFETDSDLTSTTKSIIFSTEGSTLEFTSARTELPTTDVETTGTSSTVQDEVSSTTDSLYITGSSDLPALTSTTQESTFNESTISTEPSTQTFSDEVRTGVTDEFRSSILSTIYSSSDYDLKTTQTIPSICGKGDGAYSKPGECNAFYICRSGIPYEVHCPSELHFSSSTSRCEFPCDAKCDLSLDCGTTQTLRVSTPLPFKICPRADFLPAKKCSQFTNCSDGIPSQKTCPSGLHFNASTRVCDWPENARCGEMLQPLPNIDHTYQCPCETCLVHSESSCSSYYLCLNRRAHHMECSSGLHFDTALNTCNIAEDVPCTVSTTENSSTVWTTTTSRPKPFQCLERNGLYRDPMGCTTFIQCSNWLPYHMVCPANLHFSTKTLRCEYPCDAQCDPDLSCIPTTETVPTANSTCTCLNCRLPNPESCTKYIECTNGKPQYKECRRGQTFDSKRKVCDWAHKVKCTHSQTCPRMNGLFPHKDDCHKFIHCSNGIPYIKNCPYVLEFDPMKLRCEWPSGRCGQPKQQAKPKMGPAKGWECPEPFGYFADMKNCSKFYHCSDSTPSSKECPEDLYYNPRHQTCDWMKHVKCKEDKHHRPRRCRRISRDVVCPEDKTHLPHPDCGMFYDCSSGQACAKRCPVGLYFNSELRTCDMPKRVKCSIGENESYDLKDFSEKCTKKKHGFMVDPANKACYYRCREGKVIRGCCPRNRVFNERKGECEYNFPKFHH